MCQANPEEVAGARKDPAAQQSYSQQFRSLKGCTDRNVVNIAHPKATSAAQAKEPGAYKLPFSDVYAKHQQRPLMNITTEEVPAKVSPIINMVICTMRCVAITLTHIIAFVYAPKYFSWSNLLMAALIYTIPGIFGITLGYHRLLTHRSFKCYKWFEYFCAFMGVNAAQGDPIEWVSHHRYHHTHTDTPLDPHSPYEGFWWAHMGWLFNTDVYLLDHANVSDLKAQWFYRFLEVAWIPYLFLLKPYLIYQYGGLELLVWTTAVPVVYGYHTTFLVNSAAHVYGRRPYETGDLSTNCWWVALLAFGEGWHNSHHAFPYSARHGLEWWEFDMTWCLICLLERLGIVWDVQVPSERAKAQARNKSKSGSTGRTVSDLTAKTA